MLNRFSVVALIAWTLVLAVGSDAQPAEPGLSVPHIRIAQTDPSSSSSLWQEAVELYQQERYQEAAELGEKLVQYREEHYGPEHPSTTMARYFSGLSHGQIGKYDKAADELQKVLAHADRDPSFPQDLKAKCLKELATVLDNASRSAEAQEFALRYLNWCEAEGGDVMELGDALVTCASIAQGCGKLAEAAPLYRRALSIYDQVPDAHYHNYSRCLGGLAFIYMEQGEYAEGLPLAKAAVATLREGDPDSASLVIHLYNLGYMLRETGRKEEALTAFGEAWAQAERVGAPPRFEPVVILDDLRNLKRELGEGGR